MTAEVLILNKNAIAIAADSAVTIKRQGTEKISNTANKLFRLSKKAPIGILVYQNSSINSIPWELLIKDFRSKSISVIKSDIYDYMGDFINHISNTLINDSLGENTYINRIVVEVYSAVSQKIQEGITERARFTSELLSKDDLLDISRKVLAELDVFVSGLTDYEGISEQWMSETRTKFEHQISSVLFSLSSTIDASLLPQIHDICAKALFKSIDSDDYSGIVIFGYGSEDFYPGYSSIKAYGILNKQLLYSIDKKAKITNNIGSIIVPLAQRDVVDTFITGVNPDLELTLYDSVSIAKNEIYEVLISGPEITDHSAAKLAIRSSLDSIERVMLDKIRERKSIISSDIINAVTTLQVIDLAQMAKSLVELTSFRRKVSSSIESVGGPVDVAVISKGDGFIWIERKHYFKRDLNEHFFDGYSER